MNLWARVFEITQIALGSNCWQKYQKALQRTIVKIFIGIHFESLFSVKLIVPFALTKINLKKKMFIVIIKPSADIIKTCRKKKTRSY